jgi:hypothetical protein
MAIPIAAVGFAVTIAQLNRAAVVAADGHGSATATHLASTVPRESLGRVKRGLAL